MLGWVFRRSAVFRGCSVRGEKTLWKAGQVSHAAGGAWRRIRREHGGNIWTKPEDPHFLFA